MERHTLNGYNERPQAEDFVFPDDLDKIQPSVEVQILEARIQENEIFLKTYRKRLLPSIMEDIKDRIYELEQHKCHLATPAPLSIIGQHYDTDDAEAQDPSVNSLAAYQHKGGAA